MEITIFKGMTTEGVIASIEENSAKYHQGFYADMNNLPERKLVKESAADINNMIKELKATRIKITKANTAAVNKEHDAILARLEAANLPFTSLIDAYNVERKKVLDAEKANKAAIEAKIKYESDHELGLLLNKTFEYDREQELKAQAEIEKARAVEREEYAAQQVKLAEERQVARLKQEEQNNIDAENARLANKKHLSSINSEALRSLVKECNLTDEQAKAVVIAIARNKIQHTQINY